MDSFGRHMVVNFNNLNYDFHGMKTGKVKSKSVILVFILRFKKLFSFPGRIKEELIGKKIYNSFFLWGK